MPRASDGTTPVRGTMGLPPGAQTEQSRRGHGGSRMSRVTWGWAVLLSVASACSSGGALPVQPGTGGLDKTGLEGTARRGPVQPVCRVGEACDAPLQAGFTLQQGGRVVASFASDSTGHFLVYAAPGTYVV